MSDFVHYGSKSWWDGTVTTLCGIRWSRKEGAARRDHSWFPTPKCPSCVAIRKGGKR
jgi:hypothetical protein